MTLQGATQLQHRLTAIGDTRIVLRRIQVEGVREAKLLVPRRTGNLGRTIRLGDVTANSATIIAGGNRSVGYARFVEFGTRAHDIVPRNRKALAWGGRRTLAGRLASGSRATNFATRVHHPGTKAKPFLIPGLLKAARMHFADAVVQAWDKAA